MPNHRSIHGILLLGGQGTRLRPAYRGNKHLIPVGGRAMADYGRELLNLCGIETVTAVVGPDDLEAFRRLFARTAPHQDISFVVQPQPLGTADALRRCAGGVRHPYVVTLWGDNLFEFAPERAVRRFLFSPTSAMITIARTPNPRHFSTVTFSGGRVDAIVDKPVRPATGLVCAGLMMFEAEALFRTVEDVAVNARGECDVMDAVRGFLRAGQLDYELLTGCWFDAAVSAESLSAAAQFATDHGFNHLRPAREAALSWT